MPKPKKEVKDVQVIQAYFPTYHATEKSGQDEVQDPVDEEDTLEDFLDLEEEKAVQSGAPYAKAISVPSRERIMMMTKKEELPIKIKVKGKFLMDGPWCNASFRAVKDGDVYICQGTPTYMLRNEKGQNGNSLLQLLLLYVFSFPKPGGAEDQMKKSFWDYFENWRSINMQKDYTFKQFFKALEDALIKKEISHDDITAIPMMQVAKVIMQRFDPSNECFGPVSSHGDEEEKKPRFDLRYVYRCFKCPQLFKVLPLLMERVALSIMSTKILGDLERLESVLQNSPEDLGFYTSMREHNWGTLEVSFQAFVNAGMIPANLFKCTANQDSAPQPSSNSSGKQNCTLEQPSTSSANQDTVGPSSSKPKIKQNSNPRLTVKMAKVLKLYDIVKSMCRDGKHTFLYESDMQTAWHRDACQKVHFGHSREEPFVELQNREVVKIEEETSQSRVKFHLMRYCRYEESLARSMERLLAQHDAKPWTLPVEDFSEFKFDSYQKGAALHVCQNALTIILGRGGCGKTHVVASVIRKYLDYLEENRRLTKVKELTIEGNDDGGDEEKDKDWDLPAILLTAPTGRAASILERRTKMEAKTLHSVLGIARKNNHEEFIYSKVEILVVDECSLVPISVLSEVLSTLLDHSLKKVMFLGDQHQLPSIDPGNFLQDIIEVFKTTNHNFIQTLEINHRTDEGGRLIVENARRIAEEKRSDLVYQPDRFEMLDTSVCGNGQDKIVEKLIRTKPQLRDHKNTQLVAFRNVDVKNINNVCCHYYAKHAPFKKGVQHNHHIGDKICARKNSTIRILGRSNPKDEDQKKQGAEESEVKADNQRQREGKAGGSEVKADNQRQREGEAGPSKKKEEQDVESYRISNGDTFFIENMREVVDNNGKKKEIVTLQSMDEEEGTLFEVDFKEMRTRSKLQYAWARTIHTFQGSETDYIVYVISPNSFYETWQHLYTAITRGCKGCIIVGTPARLKRVVKTNPSPRQTSLASSLRENLCELPISRSNPVDVDLRTPDRPAPGNFSSSNSAKPNRGKRKVKSNTVPVNQDVPCLQGGDSTSPVHSGVPKKKSCKLKLFSE